MSKEEREEGRKTWQERTAGRDTFQGGCSTEGVEEEAKWIETSLTDILNSHQTSLSITAGPKQL